MDALRILARLLLLKTKETPGSTEVQCAEEAKRETASYTARDVIRRREVKTVMLLLVLMTGVAWGQKSETCKACPSAADIDRQLYPKAPKERKPEKAKEQRPAKHAPKAKDRSDAEIHRQKEPTAGERAQAQQP